MNVEIVYSQKFRLEEVSVVGGKVIYHGIYSRFSILSDTKLITLEAHTYHHGVHQFLAFAFLESAQTRGLASESTHPHSIPFHANPPTWQSPPPLPLPLPPLSKKFNNKIDKLSKIDKFFRCSNFDNLKKIFGFDFPPIIIGRGEKWILESWTIE